MRIPQNKDLDTDYKNEIYKGLDARDIAYGAISIAVIIATAVCSAYYLKVPTELCVLIGIIPAAPVMFLGFYKIQGMTPFAYFKEFLYDKMTEELIYEADELPENNEVWSMLREPEKGRKKR